MIAAQGMGNPDSCLQGACRGAGENRIWRTMGKWWFSIEKMLVSPRENDGKWWSNGI